jgi:hypothetical protein
VITVPADVVDDTRAEPRYRLTVSCTSESPIPNPVRVDPLRPRRWMSAQIFEYATGVNPLNARPLIGHVDQYVRS